MYTLPFDSIGRSTNRQTQQIVMLIHHLAGRRNAKNFSTLFSAMNCSRNPRFDRFGIDTISLSLKIKRSKSKANLFSTKHDDEESITIDGRSII